MQENTHVANRTEAQRSLENNMLLPFKIRIVRGPVVAQINQVLGQFLNRFIVFKVYKT